jgi:hypothetical protein
MLYVLYPSVTYLLALPRTYECKVTFISMKAGAYKDFVKANERKSCQDLDATAVTVRTKYNCGNNNIARGEESCGHISKIKQDVDCGRGEYSGA